MESEDPIHAISFEHARLADDIRAAGGFLSRLEHEQHIAHDAFGIAGDAMGEPENHRHMAVMAACVHASRVRRTERHACFLADGQGVHIRPDRRGRIGAEVEECADGAFAR